METIQDLLQSLGMHRMDSTPGAIVEETFQAVMGERFYHGK